MVILKSRHIAIRIKSSVYNMCAILSCRADMENLSVLSNWNSSNENSLKKLITCISGEYQECDIYNISAENCLCLTKPKTDISDSQPFLEIKSTDVLNQVVLLSEGSFIEVFGDNNEYLFSCSSKFVDDWEGMAVYYAKITLPNVKYCKLKFTRTKDKTRLWIYNVQCSLFTSKQSLDGKFNFDKVNNLISSSSQQISARAEQLKNFVEAYIKTKSVTNHQSNQLSTLEGLEFITKKESSSYFEALKKVLSLPQVSSEAIKDSDITTKGDSAVEKNYTLVPFMIEHLKKYIDDRLIEIKGEMLGLLEVKLNEFKIENDAKIDKIISILNTLQN